MPNITMIVIMPKSSTKKKTTKKKSSEVDDPIIEMLSLPKLTAPEPIRTEVETGHIDGSFWVWPDGRKTHLRFIGIAVRKMKNLPKGFYDAAKKHDERNLNILVRKAKSLGLTDTVEMP